MRILVIPELDWVAALQNRVHKIFQRLVPQNEVHVIYLEHDQKGIKKSYRLKNGIVLHKAPIIPVKNMLIFYLTNALSIYSYINRIIRAYNIEIIVTTNFLFAPLAIRAAKKNSITLVFDLVDFQPYHVYYLRPLPSILKSIGSSILTSLLNYDIKRADYVITTGKPLLKYVKQLGVQNTSIISNGVDENLFSAAHNGSLIQKAYNLTSPVITFVGALEYWIDYDLIFKTISLLIGDFPQVQCFLIGPSRHYGLTKIKQMAIDYNVSNHVIFTGRVPYPQLASYICASDICILPFVKNYLTHCIIPMKLFEYLACERPVVSVPLAGIKSVAKDAVFYAETPEDFCKNIHLILEHPQDLEHKIQLGLNLIKKYSWTDLSFAYGQALNESCKKMK